MSTNTPKLNLIKPDFNDVVDITDLNSNADDIDAAVGATIVTSTTRPTAPWTGQIIYETNTDKALVWDGTAWELTGKQPIQDLTNVTITTPSAGQKLVFDGTNWVNLTGYVFVQTVYFTSSGTFTKATYPWLRAIRVKCQGAGGGAGSGSASAGQSFAAGGGGGGGYAESFFTDIAGLSSSVTVTVGAGGAGGASGGNTDGSAGGNTVFGSGSFLVQGFGGQGSIAANNALPFTTSFINQTRANQATSLGTGQLVIGGQAGQHGHGYATALALGGVGGASLLSGTQSAPLAVSSGTGGTGSAGALYGGGGSGAACAESSTAAGGAGANGIVIVELYA